MDGTDLHDARERDEATRFDEENRLKPEFLREVREALGDGDEARVYELVEPLHPADIADILEQLSPKDQDAVIESLDLERAAEVVTEMEEDAGAELIGRMDVEKAADILEKVKRAQASLNCQSA